MTWAYLRTMRHFQMSLSVVTSMWNRRFGFRLQAERRVSVLRNAMTGSRDHQASCSVGNGEMGGGGVRFVKLTSHCCLVPKLRMSGAEHYATHTTFTFT